MPHDGRNAEKSPPSPNPSRREGGEKRPLDVTGKRHLYLLAFGVILGVLLGPAFLGRALPSWHTALFGGTPLATTIAAYRADTSALDALEATGVSKAAVAEERDRRAITLRLLDDQLNRTMDTRALQLIAAVGVALLAVALVQAVLINPRARSTLDARLTTARYALLALLLALAFARPANLRTLPWFFTLTLIALALLPSLAPRLRPPRT